MGLFGAKRPDDLAMPGVISGYGGGTWNADGSMPTPAGYALPAVLQAPNSSAGMPVRPQGGGNLFAASRKYPLWAGGAGSSADVAPQGTDAPSAPPAPQAPASGVPQISPTFDAKGEYDSILQQLEPPKQQATLGHVLTRALQILGPAMMAAGGNQAGADAAIARLAQQRRDTQLNQQTLALQLLKWKQQEYARSAELAADTSKPFTIGHDRVQYDPTTGQAHTLYHGPQDFEAYAAAQGVEPGTEAYNQAVQDYVLRSSGPTALDNSETLDHYRTGNRASLEGLRQKNRLSMEGVRQGNRLTLRGTPSYHDIHPLPSRGGGGGKGEITATGPNGQKIKLVNGQWVPAQ